MLTCIPSLNSFVTRNPGGVSLKLLVQCTAVLCMLLSAIATAVDVESPRFVNVGITDNQGTSIGLKFVPPDEPGWSTERAGMSATLRKNATSDGGSKEIEAYLVKLDSPVSPLSGYIETIRRNLVDGYANSKKFKISALELAEDTKDDRCVRGHLLLEAIEPDQATRQKKWSEQYFLSCGLLKHKGLGFELRYYHRYLDSKKDPQFAEDARRVLDSAIIDDN